MYVFSISKVMTVCISTCASNGDNGRGRTWRVNRVISN